MLDLFFLTVLFIIGTVVTYQDITIGKVRNRFIVIGLLAGAVGYLSLVAGALFFSNTEFIYLRAVLINFSFAWVVSFLIWYFGLWSAGDAKFFMLLSFLLPLKYYGDRCPVSCFPSLNLFLNTFILVLIFIMLEIFLTTLTDFARFILDFKEYRKDFKKKLHIFINKIKENKIKYLKLICGYLCVFVLVRILGFYLRKKLFVVAPILENFSYILMILLFRPLNILFRRMTTKIFWLPAVILLIYFLYNTYISPEGQIPGLSSIFRRFAGFMGIIFAVRLVIKLYLQKKETIKVELEKLKPKMVLTEESGKKINKFLKEESSKEKFYPDGLTVQQVNRIRSLPLKDSDLSELRVYKTFPLAPFIFLGTLATILARGPVLNIPLLVSFFRQSR